jgi:CDP-paratose 2-epimerase
MTDTPSPARGLIAANTDPERPVLVTGGAGFIGANIANHLLSSGQRVRIFDDVSRIGVDQNLEWLSEKHNGRIEIEIGDVRDRAAVKRAIEGTSGVFHLAAQTAVTTSIQDPWLDFEVNVVGTLNLLEELRRLREQAFFVYTSTNKVYGPLADLAISPQEGKYQPVDRVSASHGIAENRRLDFLSPFGCSKGAADQYVLDWARTYRLPCLVLRISCTYGPRQFGSEEQGFVAHFMRSVLSNQPLTVWGDGKQVRDLVFIDDMVEALTLAATHAGKLAGRAFNIGGGVQNAVSILEVLDKLEDLHGVRPNVEFKEWRPGDQRYFVTDYRAFKSATAWTPKIGVEAGLARLYRWMCDGRAAQSPQPAQKAAP